MKAWAVISEEHGHDYVQLTLASGSSWEDSDMQHSKLGSVIR